MAGEVYLSNLVGNFDYQPILEKFRLYKSQQIFLLQDKEALLQQKKSAYASFGNLIDKIKDSVDNLLNPTLFSEKLAEVSDETVVSVSITNSSALSETNIDLQVNQLAKNDVWLSDDGVSDKDSQISSLNSGTLTISYKGNSIDISYDSNDSLQSIVDKINQGASDNNLNITATVFYDGSKYRLLVKGLDTGSSSTVSISDSNSGSGSLTDALGGFSNVQAAQDAEISIYGQTVTSETNDFNNTIAGLSISVKKETSNPVNITVIKNPQPLKDSINTLVDTYNSIVDFIKNNTGQNDILSGDTTLQSIRSAIFRQFSPLMELELLNVDKNTGHISINENKLDEYINNNPDTLKDKISQLSSLKDYLYTITDPYGPIKSKEKSFSKQIQGIEKKIEQDTKRINEEIEIMKRQFVSLQMYMAQMEDIKLRLSAMFFNGQQPQ